MKSRSKFYNYYNQAKFEKAHRALLRALEIVDKNQGWVHEYPQVLRLYSQLPSVHLGMGNVQEALDACQEAKSIILKEVGKHHKSYPILLNNRAYIYVNLGCYEKALAIYQEALRIYERVEGARHSLYPVMLNNVGNIYEETGKTDKALAHYKRAVEIDTRKPFKPQRPLHIHDLARLLLEEGREKRSLRLYQKARQIFRDTIGTDHPYYARMLKGMGSYYQQSGPKDKALPLYKEALMITKDQYGQDHPKTIE